MASNAPERVSFITAEVDDDGDLMVAFALDLGEPGEVATLSLMRSPEFEPLLHEDDRGVRVSHELHREEEDDFLQGIRMTHDRVEIETISHDYLLDISRVDPEELREAKEILRRMNFDDAFGLDLG